MKSMTKDPSSSPATANYRSSHSLLNAPLSERHGVRSHLRGGGKLKKRSSTSANTGGKRNPGRNARPKKSIWDDEEALINKQESPLYEPKYRDRILAAINHPAASAIVAATPLLSLSNDEIRRAIELFQNDGAVGLHDGPFLLEAAAASKRRQSGDFEAFEEAQFIELWCKDDSSSEEYSDDDYEEAKPESYSNDFDINFDMGRPSSELSELDDFDMYQPEPDGFSDGASDGNATENGEDQEHINGNEVDQNSLRDPEASEAEAETPQAENSSKLSSDDGKDEAVNSYGNGSASPNGYQSKAESEEHHDI